jgi:hypothetical protein
MRNKLSKLVSFLVPLAVMAATALPAAAQGGHTSDLVIFVDPDDNIFFARVNESEEMPGVFIVINVPGVADPAQVGNPTALIETNPKKGNMISDIFGVLLDPAGGAFFAFGSDAGDGSDAVFPDPPTIFIEEPLDGIVDMTMYASPAAQAAGWLVIFVSR